MDFNSVLYATCLAAAIATLLMGLLANYPVALAPGMGENFFLVYTLCGAERACSKPTMTLSIARSTLRSW